MSRSRTCARADRGAGSAWPDRARSSRRLSPRIATLTASRPNWQAHRHSASVWRGACRGAVTVSLGNEHGIALVLVLLFVAFAGALAGVLVLVSAGESLVASHAARAGQAQAAATAIVELVALDLQGTANWDLALSGAVTSHLNNPAGCPTGPSGLALNLAAATATVQARSDAVAAWGADRPVWRLFASGPLAGLAQLPAPHAGLCLAAWVADDGGDGDGDPARDTNGIVQVWGEARGPDGTKRAVTAAFARVDPAPAPIRRVWWRVGP